MMLSVRVRTRWEVEDHFLGNGGPILCVSKRQKAKVIDNSIEAIAYFEKDLDMFIGECVGIVNRGLQGRA